MEPRRRKANPYVPPQKRNKAGGGFRSIDELLVDQSRQEVPVECTVERASTVTFPLRKTATTDEGRWITCVSLDDEEQLQELLQWVSAASARIAFPASLSKRHRAELHKMAKTYELASYSTGSGEERSLTITAGDTRLAPVIEDSVRTLYRFGQHFIGPAFDMSLNELTELLAGDTSKWPELLRDLATKQRMHAQFLEHVRADDVNAIDALLVDSNTWVVRWLDPESRELPLATAIRARAANACTLLVRRGADSLAYDRRSGLTMAELARQHCMHDLVRLISAESELQTNPPTADTA
jgi:hypothetical protein